MLKKLQADGLSCSQIAGELGGVTRNAVIGKLHRLGLAGAGPQRPARVRAPRAPRQPRQLKARTRVAALFCEPVPEVIEADIPIAQRCTLLELNGENCHWPIGDPASPEFFFCGGKAPEGSPYCGWHARIAYTAPPVRRDRRPASYETAQGRWT
jgi:GcrA cell cycle regulator